MSTENFDITIPAEFLLNMGEVPAISCFTDENNEILTEEESEKRVVFKNGKYTHIDPALNVIIMGSKEEKLQFVAEVMINQMQLELQFGNVLNYPDLNENLEKLIRETLIDYDPLQLINEISTYSKKVIKRSTYACGVGIALALFSGYEVEITKAIGMGCLLHEYGYLVNPKDHTTAGCNSLEMRIFSQHNAITRILLNIIQNHHSFRPHVNPAVDSGKIAIHWASQEDDNHHGKMQKIKARKRMYTIEVYNNFNDLYKLMRTRD